MEEEKQELEQGQPQQSEEQRERGRRLEVASDLRKLFQEEGWAHRSRLLNLLLEEQGRLLENSVDGYEIYRAQGAYRVLARMQNTLINAAKYGEEGYEMEYEEERLL